MKNIFSEVSILELFNGMYVEYIKIPVINFGESGVI
jgi:hypothetical protein